MNDISVTEGDLVIRDARIALLVSRFNSFVVESLLDGALDTLKRRLFGRFMRDVPPLVLPDQGQIPGPGQPAVSIL